jgi:hypothetical protein
MPIEPKTNDFVQGGEWRTTPGGGRLMSKLVVSHQLTSQTARNSGLYALAMAMATEPDITRPTDWAAGTLESRYFETLMDLYIQYIDYNDGDYVLSKDGLSDIIGRWNRRYKDTYTLYIDNEDDIQLSRIKHNSARNSKTILVRCYKGRWQACCHFGEGKSVMEVLFERFSEVHNPATPSSVNIMHDQTSDCGPSVASGEHNMALNGVNNISVPVRSAMDRLVNTLERLVSGVEDRRAPDQNLIAVVDEATASIDKVAWTTPTEAGSAHDDVINDYDFEAGTEHELALETPSIVHDCGATGSPCNLENCDLYYTHIQESVEAHLYKKFGPESDLPSSMDKKPTCSPEKTALMKQACR